MDTTKELEKRKVGNVEIDNSLKKYLDKPIFQEKHDKANEMLEKFGLPDFEKLKNDRQQHSAD